MEKDFEHNNENAIEFLTGQHRATVTFTQQKWINRMNDIKERYPDDVDIVVNNDGSICGHVPSKWIKINPPKQVSEEFRKAAGERLRLAREQGKL
jgi:hypothetical protein